MNRRQTYGGMMNKRMNHNNNRNMVRHSVANPLGNNRNVSNIGGNRRKSMMRNSHKISDPRPLKDKQWIESKLQILIEYLMCHGYDAGMLSVKELNPPSTKTFQYITCFLFQQIDPSFRIINKFEEECISFYDKLGYPFKINKSSLRCLAPHSWPSLLGAISWIVELLMFAETFDIQNNNNKDDDDDVTMKSINNKEEKDGNDSDADGEFNNIICDNYELWLKGIDDDESITKKLLHEFHEKLNDLNDDIANFDKANNQLIFEKKRLQKEFPQISDLQDKRQVACKHLDAIKKTLSEREIYVADLKKKLNKWQNDVNNKNIKINQSNDKINKLKDIISKQNISPQDVARMNKESASLNAENDELNLQKNELRKNIWNITEKLQEIVKKIQTNISSYNNFAEKCEIIPHNAKYSCNQHHKLELLYNISDINNLNDLDNIDLNELKYCALINQDLDRFCDILQQMSAHYNNKLRGYETTINNKNDEISQIKCDLELKKDEINVLRERLVYITTLFNEEKSKMLQLTASTAASIEKIELEMSKKDKNIDIELKNQKNELIKVNDKYNKTFEEFKKIEIDLCTKVSISIQRIIKHRKNIRETLKNVNKRLDESLNKVAFYHIQEPTFHIQQPNDQNDQNDII